MRVGMSSLLPLRAAARTVTAGSAGRSSHESRVAIVAATMGQELRLGESEQEAIITCALLHDVGKSLLPRALCEKPGPLTRPEWALMRRHPEMSEQIALGFVSDLYVLHSIRAHHERWDGAGYPQGLAGTLIPLAARVVALADAFVAMTEDRPYRAALCPAAAHAELRRETGHQFDPLCVDAFEGAAAGVAERLAAWRTGVCSLARVVDSAVERLEAEVQAGVERVLGFAAG